MVFETQPTKHRSISSDIDTFNGAPNIINALSSIQQNVLEIFQTIANKTGVKDIEKYVTDEVKSELMQY